MSQRKAVLCILDGFGVNDRLTPGDATKQAHTPFFDYLYQKYPSTLLKAHGEFVGLLDNFMGNSEVGHLTIGAGRVIPQKIKRINEEIRKGTLKEKITRALQGYLPDIETNKTGHNWTLVSRQEELNTHLGRNPALFEKTNVHVVGLLSDGGIHSHIEHIKAVIDSVDPKFSIYVHAITDGRDTHPKICVKYLHELIEFCESRNKGTLATICGRFYAMDRDNNYDRIEMALNAILHQKGYFDSVSIESEHLKNDRHFSTAIRGIRNGPESKTKIENDTFENVTKNEVDIDVNHQIIQKKDEDCQLFQNNNDLEKNCDQFQKKNDKSENSERFRNKDHKNEDFEQFQKKNDKSENSERFRNKDHKNEDFEQFQKKNDKSENSEWFRNKDHKNEDCVNSHHKMNDQGILQNKDFAEKDQRFIRSRVNTKGYQNLERVLSLCIEYFQKGSCCEKKLLLTQIIDTIYMLGYNDENTPPISFDKSSISSDQNIFIFCNFRQDRMRQIVSEVSKKFQCITMTRYSDFRNVHVLFDQENLNDTLAETIAKNGLTQTHIAETEKYAHVTYFLNGYREPPFDSEKRIMIDSKKLKSFDLDPAMRTAEICQSVCDEISKKTDFIVFNIAAPDMVGHTGNFEATVKAIEVVDKNLKKVYEFCTENDYTLFITADHGNAEVMIDENGFESKKHTSNPVPFIICDEKVEFVFNKQDLSLANVTPTLLEYLGLEFDRDLLNPSIIKKS